MRLNAQASMALLAAAFAAAASLPPADRRAPPDAAPETVEVAPGTFGLRLPGEYLKDGDPVDAPVKAVEVGRAFSIMKFQVSAADYARCAAAGACDPSDVQPAGDPETLPATGISYRDATAYAAWLSERTGASWRLPTDAEWAFAAAERFRDDALLAGGESGNPAARWLARYRSESAGRGQDRELKSLGSFGVNSKGLADVAGNVWEWTTTCYARTRIEDGTLKAESVGNCGVRVVEGRHRGYMSYFIRDGKSGGCAAGMAPDNLGLRLVREPDSFVSRLRNLFAFGRSA